MGKVKAGKAVHPPARWLVSGILSLCRRADQYRHGCSQENYFFHLRPPGQFFEKTTEGVLLRGLAPPPFFALQMAVHAGRPGEGLRRRAGEGTEEEVRTGARTCMRIMAGGALHSAGEQRYVAVAVHGECVRCRLTADACRRGS